jgi:hypothetical protein
MDSEEAGEAFLCESRDLRIDSDDFVPVLEPFLALGSITASLLCNKSKLPWSDPTLLLGATIPGNSSWSLLPECRGPR